MRFGRAWPMALAAFAIAAWAMAAAAGEGKEDKGKEKEKKKEKQVEGKIVSRRGDFLTVDAPKGETPAKGKTAELFKFFKKKIGPAETTGWIDIARVKVEKGGRRIWLTILERKSDILVDGKKVDHFKVGAKVKLTWK